jgi:hypothetical protein
MNFISAFDELSSLYEKKALHEGYTVKYGRGSKGVDFDSLEDAVQHINDGMQKRSQQSYVLYQDGKELIWLDWYTANRDGSDSNWSESRKATKAPVSFDKKEGKLSVIEEALTEGDDYWRHRPYYDQSQKDRGVIKPYQKPANYQGTQSEWERACRDSEDFNRDLRRNPWESLDVEDTSKAELTEAAEDEEIEIIDDEAAVAETPAEEPVVGDEPRQVICECDKCGALIIKDEADIVVDEETDLVNVEDECQFCEEAKGYKIIGVVAPYEAIEVTTEEEGDSINETLTGDNGSDPQEAPEKDEGAPEKDEGAPVKEDLADLYRKTFDKPASTKTQQAWEDELNGEMGEISDKRRKHLEKKFAQQRDWEERHLVTEATANAVPPEWNDSYFRHRRMPEYKKPRLPFPDDGQHFVIWPGMDIDMAWKAVKELSDRNILTFANYVRGQNRRASDPEYTRSTYKVQRSNDLMDGVLLRVRSALEHTLRAAQASGEIPDRFSEQESINIRNACGVNPKTYEPEPERLWQREIKRGEPTEITHSF